jgi:ABC-type sugar transport system substrate-binding protein
VTKWKQKNVLKTIYVVLPVILLIIAGCSASKLDQLKTSNETIAPFHSTAVETEPTPSPYLAKRKIVLGFSQVGSESDWRMANTKSIQDAAAEAEIELKFMNAEQKQDNQIAAIRQFIQDQVDVIAFSPVVQSGWEPILREAKQAGIPVIVTDRTVDVKDSSLYVTLMGSDFYEEGKRAGKYLLDKMKNVSGQINIVELQGTIGSSPSIDRKKGFDDTIKANPNLKIIKSQSGDFTREQGYQVMESFLETEGTNIQALYAHNDDMALGAIEAIEKHGLHPGKDIVIVSVDGTRKALEALIANKINCVVECNPLLGPQLMQSVKELIAGKTLPKRIVTKDDIFTQDNAQREVANRKY